MTHTWAYLALRVPIATGARLRRHIEAMARVTPNDVNAWLLLTEVYLFDQRPKRALASAEQAIALAPDNSDAKLFKGAALVMDRRYREGIKILQYATAGPTQRPGWAWENLGSAYYALKMYPEAIGAYTQAVKLQPAAISAKQSLGLALKDGLRFAEALALFEELKTTNPDDPFPGVKSATCIAIVPIRSKRFLHTSNRCNWIANSPRSGRR